MITLLYWMALVYGVAAVLGALPSVPCLFQAVSILSCVWLLSVYRNKHFSRPAAWVNFLFCTVSVLLLPLDWSHVPTGIWAFTVATSLAFAAGFAARGDQ